jgi:hypothetical protein
MQIEHYEVPGEDWRYAFACRVREGITELQQERARQVKRRLYHGHRVYVVKDMTDAQIEAVARLEAERSCERAIREHDEGKARAKRNQGCAA